MFYLIWFTNNNGNHYASRLEKKRDSNNYQHWIPFTIFKSNNYSCRRFWLLYKFTRQTCKKSKTRQSTHNLITYVRLKGWQLTLRTTHREIWMALCKYNPRKKMNRSFLVLSSRGNILFNFEQTRSAHVWRGQQFSVNEKVNDHRSYMHILKKFRKGSLKKIQAWTGFETMNSGIPVQCSKIQIHVFSQSLPPT